MYHLAGRKQERQTAAIRLATPMLLSGTFKYDILGVGCKEATFLEHVIPVLFDFQRPANFQSSFGLHQDNCTRSGPNYIKT